MISIDTDTEKITLKTLWESFSSWVSDSWASLINANLGPTLEGLGKLIGYIGIAIFAAFLLYGLYRILETAWIVLSNLLQLVAAAHKRFLLSILLFRIRIYKRNPHGLIRLRLVAILFTILSIGSLAYGISIGSYFLGLISALSLSFFAYLSVQDLDPRKSKLMSKQNQSCHATPASASR